MESIASWNNRKATALQHALRLTNEAFAEHLGVHVRTVAYWRSKPEKAPLAATQQILDAAFDRASEHERQRFRELISEQPISRAENSRETANKRLDIPSLTAWITESETSNSAIELVSVEAANLAEIHTQRPAPDVLADVLALDSQVRDLLSSGKQRLSQMRELYRIESDLLAHACLLLGDMDRNGEAVEFGKAALLCAKEAGENQAKAWTVQAKTARWRERYAESAELARRGFECSPAEPIRVQLAYQEANAAALLGDAVRARRALARAEEAAESDFPNDSGVSAWSFPVARQAVFALSIATHLGNPEDALQAAATADACWEAGEPRVAGTWAQVRVGAGMAHLLNDELDGAAEEVAPVLALPPELRMATVTGYTANLRKRISEPRFAKSPLAIELRDQIDEFHAAALPQQAHPLEEQ